MVKILTEASIHKGYGHIYRCKTIADEMDAIMIIDSSSEKLPKEFRDAITADWQNIKWVGENLKDTDLVILDSYHTSIEVLEEIDKIVDKLVIIDDLMRLDYKNKIILNPNHFGNTINYDATNTVLSGINYLLTRKEFNNKQRLGLNKQVKNIFVMFGATDLLSVSEKFYEFVKDNEFFSGVTIHLVTKDVTKYEETSNVKFYCNLSGEEVCTLLRKCDFAITAGGTTIAELIKTTTPFICIKVAPNQDVNVNTAVSKGYGLEFTLDSIALIKEMFSYDVRLRMFEKLKHSPFCNNGAYNLKKYLEENNG